MIMLEEFINSRLHRQFKWGGHDCCLFAADALVHCGHPDYLAGLRGYTTELGGFLALRREAGVTLLSEALQWIARENGFTPASGAFQDGDVALMRVPCRAMRYFKENAGIAIYFSGRFYTTAPVGVLALEPERVIECWRPTCL